MSDGEWTKTYHSWQFTPNNKKIKKHKTMTKYNNHKWLITQKNSPFLLRNKKEKVKSSTQEHKDNFYHKIQVSFRMRLPLIIKRY